MIITINGKQLVALIFSILFSFTIFSVYSPISSPNLVVNQSLKYPPYLYNYTIPVNVTAKAEIIKVEPVLKLKKSESPIAVEIPSWRRKLRATPLFNMVHNYGSNAICALAMNYGMQDFQKFVGSLRNTGYSGDVVLGINVNSSRSIVSFLERHNVIAYEVETDCSKPGKYGLCELVNWFAEEEQPIIKPRTLQTLRYEMYMSWAQQYDPVRSLLLLIDFRDTVFQSDPFASKYILPYQPPIKLSSILPISDEYKPIWSFDIAFFAEHYPNKIIKACPFNSEWIRGCYGSESLQRVGDSVVLCSGSTLGTAEGITHYVTKMLEEYDLTGCQNNGMDQGFHNYVYYTHRFAPARIKIFLQGIGPVHTIGAMHPDNRQSYKGDLGSYWKLRDKDGYIMNWDGTKSPAIHQWDRFYTELNDFVLKELACEFCGVNAKNKTKLN